MRDRMQRTQHTSDLVLASQLARDPVLTYVQSVNSKSMLDWMECIQRVLSTIEDPHNVLLCTIRAKDG